MKSRKTIKLQQSENSANGSEYETNKNEATFTSWDMCNVAADRIDWPEWAVNNTVVLLEQDNTIPFIARYRRELTNNMEADKLRELKQAIDELKSVQSKVKSAVTAIEKQGKMTAKLNSSFMSAQNLSEVDHLFAPYKTGSKRTLAERAKELGLEPTALQLVKHSRMANLDKCIDKTKKGISTLSEVEDGVMHILADIIAKDKDTMDSIRSLCKRANVCVESSMSRTASKRSAEKRTDRNIDITKFETYFNFKKPLKYMQPHQTLALNRGEHHKVLSVKIAIPEQVKGEFSRFCQNKWIPNGAYICQKKVIDKAIDDSFTRLIHPLMVRSFRSELTKLAEKASVDVFATNLKNVLLTPPLRGKVVMGLDPGFRHGCKFAITSSYGKILDTGVIYLHGNKHGNTTETGKCISVMKKHRCETIAIGNGTGCRETEKWLSGCISRGAFKPLKVIYCIISEAGASVYSASDAAKAELPDIDISARGAASIARRLQDPLVELVKIEPKHIGVGMYQHDISDSLLKSSLDGVVEDCVSFVGVDINVCSESMLRRVAGITSAKAKNILKWREENGPFMCREQLKSVKSLGPKTIEQCVGFIRIMPETRGSTSESEVRGEETKPAATATRKRKAPDKTSKAKKAKLANAPNQLDMTSIHPESYELTERILTEAGICIEMIGQPSSITKINTYMDGKSVLQMAEKFSVGEPTMQVIIDGLTQPIGYDFREKFEKPLFKEGVKSMEDLRAGEILTGQVTNVTHFGAFIDIGVCRDGLIHISKMNPKNMNNKKVLAVGDRIECVLLQVDVARGRINLQLSKLL